MNSERPEKEQGRRRKMRQGTQYDAMKRARKEMPPATKVIQPKTGKSANNWRDYLDDIDLDDDYEDGGVE